MSERLYAQLLRLYPRAFRDRYGEEMARVFRDRRRHEHAARVWLDVLADAVVSIPRQHWVGEPHRIYPPSAAPFRLMHNNVKAAIGGATGGALIAAAIATGFLGGPPLTNPLLWLLVVASVLALVACRRGASRMSRMLNAVRAEASGHAVTVTYPGAAPITLSRSEIIGLHDYTQRGLRIRTANPAHDLWVPAKSSSYSQMKASLSQWMPVEATPLISPEAFDIGSRVFLLVAAVIQSMPFMYVLGPVFLLTAFLDARHLVSIRKRLLTFAGIAIVLWRWLG